MQGLRQMFGGPDRESALLEANRVLLLCLKRFSLNLQDLDNSHFQDAINQLSKELVDPQVNPSKIVHLLRKARDQFLLQSRCEHQIVKKREEEFRGLIASLCRDMNELLKAANNFDDKIQYHAGELEKLADTGDLGQIRRVIRSQVESIRREITKRRERDQSSMERLNEEVARLTGDLRQARDESLTDSLTGAANRKSFEEHLTARLDRLVLGGPGFALLMWDVDNFKRVNDTYGHQAGDCVLKALVKHCQGMTRKDDLVARYGGEEFAILLDRVTKRQAIKRGRQIVSSIASTDVLFNLSGKLTRLSPTVSMGVAFASSEDVPESLIARCDQALYRAKRAGKNRVESD